MENRTRIKSCKQDAQPRKLSAVGHVTPIAEPSCCQTSHMARNEAHSSVREPIAVETESAQSPRRFLRFVQFCFFKSDVNRFISRYLSQQPREAKAPSL